MYPSRWYASFIYNTQLHAPVELSSSSHRSKPPNIKCFGLVRDSFRGNALANQILLDRTRPLRRKLLVDRPASTLSVCPDTVILTSGFSSALYSCIQFCLLFGDSAAPPVRSRQVRTEFRRNRFLCTGIGAGVALQVSLPLSFPRSSAFLASSSFCACSAFVSTLQLPSEHQFLLRRSSAARSSASFLIRSCSPLFLECSCCRCTRFFPRATRNPIIADQ